MQNQRHAPAPADFNLGQFGGEGSISLRSATSQDTFPPLSNTFIRKALKTERSDSETKISKQQFASRPRSIPSIRAPAYIEYVAFVVGQHGRRAIVLQQKLIRLRLHAGAGNSRSVRP